jgi:hypothetical protein
MFNKYWIVLSVTTLLFSNTLQAGERERAEQSFNKLLTCMNSIHLDDEKYKGVSPQQILFVSVLKNITNDKTEAKVLDFDINHSKLYQLVKSGCPTALAEVEMLSRKK